MVEDEKRSKRVSGLRACVKQSKIRESSSNVMTLKLKVSSNKTTLVLSNTRELDRVPSTK